MAQYWYCGHQYWRIIYYARAIKLNIDIIDNYYHIDRYRMLIDRPGQTVCSQWTATVVSDRLSVFLSIVKVPYGRMDIKLGTDCQSWHYCSKDTLSHWLVYRAIWHY